MSLSTIVRSLAVAAALLMTMPGAHAQDTTDRLGIPGPLSFGGTDHVLAWSAQPSPAYIKQEYVPDGQEVASYTSMVLVELVTGVDVGTALAAQVNALNQRRGSDPLLNLDVIRNDQTGEAILDFIVSATDEAGAFIAEWNAYRYTPYESEAGDGVLLLAISRRAYNSDDVRAFLTGLGAERPASINELAAYAMPEVVPAE